MREDPYADCEQMQIICAAATELLDASRDPLFEVVPLLSAPRKMRFFSSVEHRLPFMVWDILVFLTFCGQKNGVTSN